MSCYRSLVVPVDFSEVTAAAVKVACCHAAEQAQIHLLHVLPPLGPTAWNLVASAAKEREAQERAHQQLEQWVVQDARIQAVIRHGDPAEEIAALAREVNAEVIVLPARSRPLLEKWLLGSVTHHVLRLAPCPVLVLPDDRQAARGNPVATA